MTENVSDWKKLFSDFDLGASVLSI